MVAGDAVVTAVYRGWCPVLLNDGTIEELEGDHFFPPASPSIPRTACRALSPQQQCGCVPDLPAPLGSIVLPQQVIQQTQVTINLH